MTIRTTVTLNVSYSERACDTIAVLREKEIS